MAVERLRAERWAKPYVRVSYSVDKKAAKEALDGKHGKQLRDLGFGTRGGAEVFVLDLDKEERGMWRRRVQVIFALEV